MVKRIAFNHALLMMGIDTIIVCSSTHSWNAVRLDGKWYYIDVTWADPVNTDTRSYARHDYMFVDAQAFTGEHLLDDMYKKEYGKILDNFGNIYSTTNICALLSWVEKYITPVLPEYIPMKTIILLR